MKPFGTVLYGLARPIESLLPSTVSTTAFVVSGLPVSVPVVEVFCWISATGSTTVTVSGGTGGGRVNVASYPVYLNGDGFYRFILTGTANLRANQTYNVIFSRTVEMQAYSTLDLVALGITVPRLSIPGVPDFEPIAGLVIGV